MSKNKPIKTTRCILCKEFFPENDLTREHIIHNGLGGPWTLPKSSCKNCQRICNEGFEQEFLKGPNMVAYARAIWGINKKKPPVYGTPGHGGQIFAKVSDEFPKVCAVQTKGQIYAHPQIIYLGKNKDVLGYRLLINQEPEPRPIKVSYFEKFLNDIPKDTKYFALYLNGELFPHNIWRELYNALQIYSKNFDIEVIENSNPVNTFEMNIPINHLGNYRNYAKVALCYVLKKINKNYWFSDSFNNVRDFILKGAGQFSTDRDIKMVGDLDPIYEVIGNNQFTFYLSMIRIDNCIWAGVYLIEFGGQFIKVSEEFIPTDFKPSLTLFDISTKRDGQETNVVEIQENCALNYEDLVRVQKFNLPARFPESISIKRPIFESFGPVTFYRNTKKLIHGLQIEHLASFPSEHYIREAGILLDGSILIGGFTHKRGATLYWLDKEFSKCYIVGKIPFIRIITSIFQTKSGNIICSGQENSGSVAILNGESNMKLWDKLISKENFAGCINKITESPERELLLFTNIQNKGIIYPAIYKSTNFDFNWKMAWQEKNPGKITCFSQDNNFFGVNGKNSYVFLFDKQNNICSKLFSTRTENNFTISDINYANDLLVCSINTHDRSQTSYCIYKNIHYDKKWNRTVNLPIPSKIKGIIHWTEELQVICSEQSLFSRNGLYGDWNEIYRFNFPPTDWFKKVYLSSGDVLLFFRKDLYCLKGTKFNLRK